MSVTLTSVIRQSTRVCFSEYSKVLLCFCPLPSVGGKLEFTGGWQVPGALVLCACEYLELHSMTLARRHARPHTGATSLRCWMVLYSAERVP